jgi:DNA replication protein DnaC
MRELDCLVQNIFLYIISKENQGITSISNNDNLDKYLSDGLEKYKNLNIRDMILQMTYLLT